jgi:hypothetical protein
MAKKNTQAQNNSNLPSQEQDQLGNDFDNLPSQEQDGEVPVSNSRSKYGNYSGEAAQFYGNKDHKKEHLLPADWAKKVCVFQCQIDQLNGGIVEIPNTHQLQTYDPATFEKLSKDEKGKPSFFSESKMKVTVLHDPR